MSDAASAVIALDAMGGDDAPGAIVQGALLALEQSGSQGSARMPQGGAAPGSMRVALVGNPDAIAEYLPKGGHPSITVVPAGSEVGMGEAPSYALRAKRDSSMAVAVRMVAQGEAAGVVSAGNSGAFMAFAMTGLHRVSGIDRPAIAMPFPTPKGQRILLDAGANVDCRPEHLLQFGVLGSVYCEHALGIAAPTVAVLNIGSEKSKGNDLTHAAYDLLDASPLNFVGYVEGNRMFEGDVDVVVCDGFVGNALLKTSEGITQLFMSQLRESLRSSWVAKVGAAFVLPALRALRRQYDYSSYGGALLLGVGGIAVVCHGRSSPRAIAYALRVAQRAVEHGVVEAVAESCKRFCDQPAESR